MIIAAIIVGVVLIFLICSVDYIGSHGKGDFEGGCWSGVVISIFLIIEIGIISDIIENPTPSAMDVYQGKTTLEYKVVDDVKVDSVVIFKNDTTGLNIY